MAGARQVLFIQGAALVRTTSGTTSWSTACGGSSGTGTRSATRGCPPRIDPSYPTWGPAIRWAMATLEDGAVAVGHSVGGTILMHLLLVVVPPPGLIRTCMRRSDEYRREPRVDC